MSETVATCPNCGAPRPGSYCGACGQSSRSYLRATRDLVGEALGEVLGLDSRLWRTLKCLLLRPGFLSSEFASDRRARYVSPVRLYLVVSVVFFGVLSLTARFDGGVPDEAKRAVEIQSQAAEPIDPELARMYGQLDEAQRARLKAILQKEGVATGAVEQRIRELDDAARTTPAPPLSAFERLVSDRALDLAEDPRGAFAAFLSELPFAMFLALPLYAAFLKLVYRRRYYAEHVVFALHLHAFLFCVGTLVLLLPDAPSQSGVVRALTGAGAFAAGTLQFVALGYYVVALKTFYREGWTRTVAKFVIINVAHASLIGFGIALVALCALVFYR